MRDDEGALRSALPEGVRARFVRTGTGLDMHVLEAGRLEPGRKTILLLHGFPELAYSWRRVMPGLAAAGYHVIAPDQRGYGRTAGWSRGYDVDLAEFGMPALARDALALLEAMGVGSVAAVIGHDFGSPVAAWCGMMRPDVFRSVICMSAPFAGAPVWPAAPEPDIHKALAALPKPRRHYQWYYGERRANADMMEAPEGLTAFLRAYFHCKSGDWAENAPFRLRGWTADELAKLPRYYIMDHGASMAETAAAMAPTPGEATACQWLNKDDLAVYAAEYGRTGFQGGLNWYRRATSDAGKEELRLYAGKRLSVPAAFVGGARDWGVFQVPGALEAMETTACEDYRGTTLVAGAGHWVQQEAPRAVIAAASSFLQTLRGARL